MPRDLQLAPVYILLPLLLAGQAFSAKALAVFEDASNSAMVSNGKSGTALVDKLIGNVNSMGTYKYEGAQEAQTGKSVEGIGNVLFQTCECNARGSQTIWQQER